MMAEAAEFGAIETLLVVDDRLRTERQGEGDWSIDVNEVIESSNSRAATWSSSPRSSPPANSSNLGGIAAILRYRLQ